MVSPLSAVTSSGVKTSPLSPTATGISLANAKGRRVRGRRTADSMVLIGWSDVLIGVSVDRSRL